MITKRHLKTSEMLSLKIFLNQERDGVCFLSKNGSGKDELKLLGLLPGESPLQAITNRHVDQVERNSAHRQAEAFTVYFVTQLEEAFSPFVAASAINTSEGEALLWNRLISRSAAKVIFHRAELFRAQLDSDTSSKNSIVFKSFSKVWERIRNYLRQNFRATDNPLLSTGYFNLDLQLILFKVLKRLPSFYQAVKSDIDRNTPNETHALTFYTKLVRALSKKDLASPPTMSDFSSQAQCDYWIDTLCLLINTIQSLNIRHRMDMSALTNFFVEHVLTKRLEIIETSENDRHFNFRRLLVTAKDFLERSKAEFGDTSSIGERFATEYDTCLLKAFLNQDRDGICLLSKSGSDHDELKLLGLTPGKSPLQTITNCHIDQVVLNSARRQADAFTAYFIKKLERVFGLFVAASAINNSAGEALLWNRLISRSAAKIIFDRAELLRAQLDSDILSRNRKQFELYSEDWKRIVIYLQQNFHSTDNPLLSTGYFNLNLQLILFKVLQKRPFFYHIVRNDLDRNAPREKHALTLYTELVRALCKKDLASPLAMLDYSDPAQCNYWIDTFCLLLDSIHLLSTTYQNDIYVVTEFFMDYVLPKRFEIEELVEQDRHFGFRGFLTAIKAFFEEHVAEFGHDALLSERFEQSRCWTWQGSHKNTCLLEYIGNQGLEPRCEGELKRPSPWKLHLRKLDLETAKRKARCFFETLKLLESGLLNIDKEFKPAHGWPFFLLSEPIQSWLAEDSTNPESISQVAILRKLEALQLTNKQIRDYTNERICSYTSKVIETPELYFKRKAIFRREYIRFSQMGSYALWLASRSLQRPRTEDVNHSFELMTTEQFDVLFRLMKTMPVELQLGSDMHSYCSSGSKQYRPAQILDKMRYTAYSYHNLHKFPDLQRAVAQYGIEDELSLGIIEEPRPEPM